MGRVCEIYLLENEFVVERVCGMCLWHVFVGERVCGRTSLWTCLWDVFVGCIC